MEQLDLKRIWEISKILSNYDNLGYETIDEYEYFISRYAFKVDSNSVTYFNDDPVPYEDFTEEDFNTFPITLLTSTEEEINTWAENEELKMENELTQSFINEKEWLEMRIKTLDKIINKRCLKS